MLLLLATAAVMLRMISRKVSALPYWWDDTVIVASLIASYGCSAIAFIGAENGVGKHFETVPKSSVKLLLRVSNVYSSIVIYR